MTRLVGTVVAVMGALVLAACGSDDAGTGLTAASGGAAGESALLPTAGTSGSATAGGGATGGAAPGCPEARELLRPGGTLVEFDFALSLAGKPLVLGEPNAITGGQLTPSNVRFYVSEFTLLAGDGSSVAVDLVTSAGQPEPYGVHLGRGRFGHVRRPA